MLQGFGVDDNMSNLTSAISNEASISSISNNMNEMANSAINAHPLQNFQSFFSSSHINNNNNNINNNNNNQVQAAPTKKRRNLPGHPDPEADVVALSPKSLMATNRFMCEICNKGFQRDQNLQLHRRGHNLPWKLKQRNKPKKKVYVCPVPGCIHHEAARALGDLTGVKKHYSRKHGEKKWKCEKCSKRYAVQSDLKAHAKVCGTREYKCDCGTLFSRRDSFITHRAFCDALAHESSKSTTQNNPLFFPIQTSPNTTTTQLISQQNINFNNFPHHQLKEESLPLWLSPKPPTRVESSFHQNPTNPSGPISFPFSSSPSNSLMLPTALLQKAARMSRVGMLPQNEFGHVLRNWGSMHDVGMTSANGGLGFEYGFDEILESGKGLTRDFLNMAALEQMGSQPFDRHQVRQNNQGQWGS
ncbi:zinc finger protein [Striga asiatica]|uniref:Zinc finger protein n=1 Tax=Striga asiatica TaxID=4170 RepID=A0A5A7PSZ1_STRAF|nr:zinc finger protein [Striga asiatica]